MTTQRFVQLFTLLLLCSTSAMAGMSPELLALSESWAKIKYQLPEAQRIDALEALSEKAKTLVNAHPGEAEPLVWQAIIISTTAGEKGGLGALSLVKEAKALLEQAEAIKPETLEGSVYTSLGTLYYQVPGWPLGFGDDDEAERYLKMALAVNPEGIDPNYIYGDFLMQEKAYEEAAAAFKRALVAPPREDRPIADAGRRTEIEAALAELKQAGYN